MKNLITAKRAGTAVLFVTLAASRAAASTLEERELVAASPEAAALVRQADAAARDGRVREAWELYGRAWPLALRSPLPARGICRLALALGIETPAQWKAARSACGGALLVGGTHEDVHNKAAAELSVTGSLRPTIDDFVSASLGVDGAVQMAPEDPWGYVGRGELALWLGDRGLLDGALAQLGRVAPDHPETLRLRALAAPPVPRGVWAAWILIAALFLTTAAHAAARRYA